MPARFAFGWHSFDAASWIYWPTEVLLAVCSSSGSETASRRDLDPRVVVDFSYRSVVVHLDGARSWLDPYSRALNGALVFSDFFCVGRAFMPLPILGPFDILLIFGLLLLAHGL